MRKIVYYLLSWLENNMTDTLPDKRDRVVQVPYKKWRYCTVAYIGQDAFYKASEQHSHV